MRLPGIEYRRGVQSLGREDSNLPMREASSYLKRAQFAGSTLYSAAEATAILAESAKRYSDRQAVYEYNEQYLEAYKGMQSSFDLIHTAPVLPADTPGLAEIGIETTRTVSAPDGSTQQVPVTGVQSADVGLDLYRQQTNGIKSAALSNVKDRRARQKLELELEKLQMGHEQKLFERSIEHKKAYVQGQAELQLLEFAHTGDEEKGIELIHQSVETGVFDPETLDDRIAAFVEQVDYAKAFAIIQSGDVTAMEKLQANISILRMDPVKQMAVWDKAQSAIDKREAQADKNEADWHESNRIKATVGLLTGELDTAGLIESAHTFSPADLTVLVNLDRQLKKDAMNGEGTTDLDTYNTLALQINRLPFGDLRLGTIEERANELRQAVTGAASNGLLTIKDLRELNADITRAMAVVFDADALQDIEQEIRMQLAPSEMETVIALMQSGGDPLKSHSTRIHMAVRALRDVRRVARTQGLNADYQKWWDRNQKYYTLVDVEGGETSEQILEKMKQGIYTEEEAADKLNELGVE